MKGQKHSGYVLISVLVVLLAVLSAVVAVNSRYTDVIVSGAETNSVVRREIEKSALAHLQAYAEQSNCGANPADIRINGEKDNISYSLNWTKNSFGTHLTGEFRTNGQDPLVWTTQRKQVELYGTTDTTSWILAPYFSNFVEIRYGKENHHRHHSDINEAEVSLEKEIVLRSLNLGPLMREPISLIAAELQLTAKSGADQKNVKSLKIHAVKYPWNTENVTFSYDGIGTRTKWPEPLLEKFETLETQASVDDNTVRFDVTGLLKSWIDNSRPNYGFAISSSSSTPFTWVSRPESDNFEERPRVNLSYRCACAEACVGIKQNEALAIGTNSGINGYGGTNKQLIKLWLHRANEKYLVQNPLGLELFERVIYNPAGVSPLNVIDVPSGVEVIGIDVDPANAKHPDHHYYTLMIGQPVTWVSYLLKVSAYVQLLYLQSPSEQPLGFSLEKRVLANNQHASTQAATEYFGDNADFVAGFSIADERYWFALVKDSNILFEDYPVKLDPAAKKLHTLDTGRAQLNLDALEFNDNHVPHALHVIDQFNFLLTGEYFNSGTFSNDWASQFGQLEFHDGDIVLYNSITKKSRLIDGEIMRSSFNNVHAVGLFEEPIPPAGSSDNHYQNALPFLFE